MKVNKEFEGLLRQKNGDYVLKGNLISDETIEIDLDDRLLVRGSVISKMSIKVGRTLIAGEGIEAGSFLNVGKRIFAGTSVYHDGTNCKKNIVCTELQHGEICFGELVIQKTTVKMTVAEIKAALKIDDLEIIQ